MAYKFRDQVLYGLKPHDIQILCECGRASGWMIYHNKESRPTGIALCCDSCGHVGKIEELTELQVNADKPWRQTGE